MSKRKCSAFYCNIYKQRVCCADCERQCEDRCQNRPEVCGLVQGICRPYKKRTEPMSKDEVEKLYRMGKNGREIGKLLGVRTDRIQRWRAVNGLPSNELQKLENDKKRAIELYRAGLTCGEIAEQVGYTMKTVRKWTKEEGEND